MSNAVEDQRRRAAHWRHVVATAFRSLGIDAEARLPARRPSNQFDAQPDVRTPDLGCFVKAVPTTWEGVAPYLRRAELDAIDRGLGEIAVVIKPCPAGPPEDAYTIMRLADFAPMARDAESWRSQATDADLSTPEVTS